VDIFIWYTGITNNSYFLITLIIINLELLD
jgi:hypothetical protein